MAPARGPDGDRCGPWRATDSRLWPSPRCRAWGAATAILVAAVAGSAIRAPRPVLLWNASPSSTIGLYWIADRVPRAGETAIAWAPAAARRLADRRNYLPARVPLVKTVAAVTGDRVCARGPLILINRRLAAVRHAKDPSGRPLPWWSGCRRLQDHELFLLSPRRSTAFDGRYFGISRGVEIIGSARLLWAP